jgi:hypothetical protein
MMKGLLSSFVVEDILLDKLKPRPGDASNLL